MANRKPFSAPNQCELIKFPGVNLSALSSAISEMMKKCGLSRGQLAERISVILQKTISANELNSWASESKKGHLPRLDEMMALTMATGRPEGISALASPLGFGVIGKRDFELLHQIA